MDLANGRDNNKMSLWKDISFRLSKPQPTKTSKNIDDLVKKEVDGEIVKTKTEKSNKQDRSKLKRKLTQWPEAIELAIILKILKHSTGVGYQQVE